LISIGMISFPLYLKDSFNQNINRWAIFVLFNFKNGSE